MSLTIFCSYDVGRCKVVTVSPHSSISSIFEDKKILDFEVSGEHSCLMTYFADEFTVMTYLKIICSDSLRCLIVKKIKVLR